ncbi:hypothetical protein V5O48_002354 [Marasmius crinis-equi]|uniref:F-box domain-containing protein n=1 Tax=Marasmius crinis-equi TaxID=585013 RepID=A0ABR3FW95_9AGAR
MEVVSPSPFLSQGLEEIRHANQGGQVPVEVLRRIFKFCPFSLFQVNGTPYWRSVILSDPLLWTHLDIDMDEMPPGLASRSTNILQNVLHFTDPHPLYVRLSAQNLENVRDLPVWQGVCDVLRGSSHRWASLSYNTPPEIPPTLWHSNERGFELLEELTLTTLRPDWYRLPANEIPLLRALIESFASAPKLTQATIHGFGVSSAYLVWPWTQITVLRLMNCRIDDVTSLHQVLQGAQNLRSLFFDISEVSSTQSMPTVVLSSVYTFGVGHSRRFLEAFTLPRLNHLDVPIPLSREDRLSSLISLVYRSNVQLQSITVREVALGDVVMEEFLRAVGSEVTELTIGGFLFDYVFDCMTTMSGDLLPKLEVLRIRSDRTGVPEPDVGVFFTPENVPWEISPPLGAVAKLAGSRDKLKVLELEVVVNTAQVPGASLDITGQARQDLESLRRDGLTITTYCLDGSQLVGPTLERVGKFLEHDLYLFLTQAEDMIGKVAPIVDNTFRIVEGFLQEDRLNRDSLTMIPSLRAAMMIYAYRSPRALVVEPKLNTRERAKAMMRRLSELGGNGLGSAA